MMQLFEGDKVEVLRILNDLNMIECKYNNQVGVFPVTSLKLIKRNPTVQSSKGQASPPIQRVNEHDQQYSQKLQMQRQVPPKQNMMVHEYNQDV